MADPKFVIMMGMATFKVYNLAEAREVERKLREQRKKSGRAANLPIYRYSWGQWQSKDLAKPLETK